MVDGGFFDLLEEVARLVRGRPDPFGGLQLVLCGDFHQLPPVTSGQGAAQAQARRFCFEAAAWKACVHHCLELTQVFRQVKRGLLHRTADTGCRASMLSPPLQLLAPASHLNCELEKPALEQNVSRDRYQARLHSFESDH